jgi:hypothetical protein
LHLLIDSTIIESMDKQMVVNALAALAHPVRLDAFRALVVAGREGLAQKALAEAVGVGPTNLAQVGRFVIYRAAYERMNDLLAYLTESCCAGPAKVPAVQTSDACGC